MSLFRTRWVLAAAVLAAAVASASAELPVGKAAPPITAKSWLNAKAGAPTPESLRGKVVMVEFWGTWCNPCVQAMPHVQKLWDRYRDKGLVVLAISYEPPEVLEPFLAKNGYTMPCGSDPDKACIGAYDFKGWPHTFVVDKDGNLAYVGNPGGVEPAIEQSLGLEASPASLLTGWIAAQSTPSKGRAEMERLAAKAGLDFDLKGWAKDQGGATTSKAAPGFDAAKTLSEYVKLRAVAKADPRTQAALDLLASAAPEKFDLAAWTRDVFARSFPLTTKELGKLLDEKQFDAALDAILDRNPSGEALGTASKSIPFAVWCTTKAPDARLNAKKGLMAHLWVFAKKQPKDNEKFWQEINVTAWREAEDKSPNGLQIGGEMVMNTHCAAYVDRQLYRWLVMDAVKDGKKPALSRLREDAAKEREGIAKELRTKYEQ